MKPGVPIIGEAGVGYSIAEGWAATGNVQHAGGHSTLTAEKLIENLPIKTFSTYQSALFKIKAVFAQCRKRAYRQYGRAYIVLGNRYLPPTERQTGYQQEILKQHCSKTVIAMQYIAIGTNEISKRNIEPVGIFYGWSLVPWLLTAS